MQSNRKIKPAATLATHALLAVLFAFAMPAGATDPLASYLAAIDQQLDIRAVEALNKIEGADRQLLAARSYLRNVDRLADNWSWTEQQIESYQGSPAQQALDAGIEGVRREFESRNPGFTLFVNSQVRSLDAQIEKWNSSRSVADAGAELLLATTTFLASGAVPSASTSAGGDRFTRFMLEYVPTREATIAAPGLSLHGQMRAVDFLVKRGGTVVAGPDTATIEGVWLKGGWRDKLAAAVVASGATFTGPMEQPDEPWHYTYHGSFELPER